MEILFSIQTQSFVFSLKPQSQYHKRYVVTVLLKCSVLYLSCASCSVAILLFKRQLENKLDNSAFNEVSAPAKIGNGGKKFPTTEKVTYKWNGNFRSNRLEKKWSTSEVVRLFRKIPGQTARSTAFQSIEPDILAK